MKKKTLIATALAISIAGLGAGPFDAFAGAPTGAADRAEMQGALSAKVSMTEAIKAAEANTDGKAMEAAYTNENGTSGYEVSVVTKDGNEQTLFVDASSGKAVKATPAAENEHDDNSALDDSEENE